MISSQHPKHVRYKHFRYRIKIIRILIWAIFILQHSFGYTLNENPRLCLTMIVRNESSIIERCLENIKGLVDCISICDTGSDDNTVEIIEKFLEKNHILGKVHSHEWKNFGHNRTLSFQAAQATVKELGFDPAQTYLMLLDADMVLKVSPEFSKKQLQEDYYHVIQKASTLSYPNIRIIRSSLPWESKGVTHEYWSCQLPCKGSHLNTLHIDDKNDGGCKSDKVERDIRLLKEGLQSEPENDRYMFYLAECYKFAKDYPNAIRWYQKRIQKGNWKEEVWYSLFMIGSCSENLGQWEKALDYYLRAYDHTPTRSEPLYHIVKHYRLNQQYQLAYLFANIGKKIPRPKKEYLFISDPVYDYLFDEEISIAAFYIAQPNKGLEAVENILLKKHLPESAKKNAEKNLTYYVKNLPDCFLQPSDLKLSSEYTLQNAFFEKIPKGYRLNLYSNPLKHTENEFQVKKTYFDYSHDLSQLKEGATSIELIPSPNPSSNMHLHQNHNILWMLQMSLDTLSQSFSRIQTMPLLSSAENPLINVPKNPSLLFTADRAPFAIEEQFPFKIESLGLGNNMFEPLSCSKDDFSNFVIKKISPLTDKSFLILFRQVILRPEGDFSVYRLLHVDDQFKIRKLSTPFTFLQRDLEQCHDFLVDYENQKIIFLVETKHKQSFLACIPFKALEKIGIRSL